MIGWCGIMQWQNGAWRPILRPPAFSISLTTLLMSAALALFGATAMADGPYSPRDVQGVEALRAWMSKPDITVTKSPVSNLTEYCSDVVLPLLRAGQYQLVAPVVRGGKAGDSRLKALEQACPKAGAFPPQAGPFGHWMYEGGGSHYNAVIEPEADDPAWKYHEATYDIDVYETEQLRIVIGGGLCAAKQFCSSDYLIHVMDNKTCKSLQRDSALTPDREKMMTLLVTGVPATLSIFESDNEAGVGISLFSKTAGEQSCFFAIKN